MVIHSFLIVHSNILFANLLFANDDTEGLRTLGRRVENKKGIIGIAIDIVLYYRACWKTSCGIYL